jgi:hypothetical protein
LRFRYEGKEYDLVEAPLFAEFSWIEKQSGCALSALGETLQLAGIVLISLKRAGVHVSWEDMMATPMSAVQMLDDDAPVSEPGPSPAGAEAGPGAAGEEAEPSPWPSSVTSTGSSS